MGAKRDFALIKHSHDLGTLLDLDLTGLADNSLLQYNLATLTWEDVTVAGLNGQLDHGTLLGLADNDHPQYALAATDMIAGAGLTGGGTLAASRTFTVGAGTGITVNANDVALSAASIASLLLADTSVQPARTLTAGAGLTGGGTLASDRTFDVGAGTGITVNADDVAINQGFSPTWTGQHSFTTSTTIWDFADNTYAMSVRGATGRFLVRPYIDATFGVGFEATNTAQTLNIPITLFGNPVKLYSAGVESGRFDTDTAAGNTRFMVYDVDNGTLERVSVGVADSGGTGFKLLRIPN